MKCIKLIPFFFFICVVARGQDNGIIECQGRTSVPILEKPGSLVVLKSLPCGQKLTILGMEDNYAIIRITESRVGYVDAKFVRKLQQDREEQNKPIENQGKPKEQAEPVKSSEPARAPAVEPPSPEKPKEFKHNLGVGFDLSYLRYKQSVDAVEKKGTMFGVYGDYSIHWDKFLFRVDGNMNWGDLDYRSSGSGNLNDIRNLLAEMRFAFGRDFGFTDRLYLTPFAGIGYRYLSEETGGEVSDLGSFGPDRRSNYLYSPMGLECTFRLISGWVVIPSGEYDVFWRGWQFTRYNDIDPDLPIVKNIQKKGYGARGSFTVIKNFGHMDFFIEPYIKYWNIKNSGGVVLQTDALTETIVEPAHNSREMGVRVGVRLF
jgi:hypothetical protein